MKTAVFLLASLDVFCGQAHAGDVAATQPNVLFCIADDASPHFGVYGYDWVKTPNIDRVAQAGLVFENVYTPTAKCAPSRAAILTGRNPWQLEAAANHQSFFPTKFQSFTESLLDAGVSVGAQGKTWGPGIATTEDGQARNFGMTKSGGNAANPGAGFREFLAAREPGQPFFYWFGSSNPHRFWQFSYGKRPAEELFDLASDPDCVKNLAEVAAHQARKTALREILFAELKNQHDPRILGQGDVFDNYPSIKDIGASTPDAAAKKAKKKSKQKAGK